MWELPDLTPAILVAGAVCGLGIILMMNGPRRGYPAQTIFGAIIALIGFLLIGRYS